MDLWVLVLHGVQMDQTVQNFQKDLEVLHLLLALEVHSSLTLHEDLVDLRVQKDLLGQILLAVQRALKVQGDL